MWFLLPYLGIFYTIRQWHWILLGETHQLVAFPRDNLGWPTFGFMFFKKVFIMLFEQRYIIEIFLQVLIVQHCISPT
jgi:hypothetical protein